jgi:hypothetical protein
MDTSIRGIAAELLLADCSDVSALKLIFETIRNEKKGFVSFVLSRLPF